MIGLAMGWSAVCDLIFPSHTHLLLFTTLGLLDSSVGSVFSYDQLETFATQLRISMV